MRIVPTADKYPKATPVYRETRGPVLDLEAEVEGCAIFLSPREVAQALATKGVLEWSRVREVLEARGWVSPENDARRHLEADEQIREAWDAAEKATVERDQLLAALALVKEVTRAKEKSDVRAPRKATA